MARLDVYANPIGEHRREVPFWVDVQSDFLKSLDTRVVLPLRRLRTAPVAAQRLNPVFTVEGIEVFLDAANIATFPAHRLGKRVTSLGAHRFDIDNALDMLFQGL